jgi:hypothetical protein
MPIRNLLIRVANLEECLFIQALANELHSDGHVVGESAGQG